MGKIVSSAPPAVPPNNGNQHELESTVFIGSVWACEGLKATKALRSPFQSCYCRALYE